MRVGQVKKSGKKQKAGFEIGNISDVNQNALHVSFSIEKADVESPNTAKVQIWNLSKKSLNVLDGKDCKIELRAGYEDTMSLILAGTISNATTVSDGADRLTELEVCDGLIETRDTVIKLSLKGSISSKSIYSKIADAMGLSIIFSGECKFKTLPNGFSYSGKAVNALKKISKLCRHKYTIQNGVILVTNPGRAISQRAYVLSAETGLIGAPKKITIAKTSKSKAKTGYEIQYLLNGAIGVNNIVNIDSQHLKGFFRVQKVTIDGDNLEGDWVCTAQVLKIAQSSKSDKKASSKKKTVHNKTKKSSKSTKKK